MKALKCDQIAFSNDFSVVNTFMHPTVKPYYLLLKPLDQHKGYISFITINLIKILLNLARSQGMCPIWCTGTPSPLTLVYIVSDYSNKHLL